MARNMIILDHSSSMRRIIKTMIQATVNDAVVSEAHDAKEAMGLTEDCHYHLVIFSWESSDKKWLEFAQKRLALPEKLKTNFVMFTSNHNQGHLEEIKRYGIQEHLIIPCEPNVLGELITRVCSHLFMRSTRRYSIPGAMAVLEQGSNSFPVEIINFSEGGMLCEFDVFLQLNWVMPAMICMEFNIDGVTIKVEGLYAVAKQQIVVAANSDYSPRRIRLAYKFINVPEVSKKHLAQVFGNIEKKEGLYGKKA